MRFSGFLCVVYVICKLFREDNCFFNGVNMFLQVQLSF